MKMYKYLKSILFCLCLSVTTLSCAATGDYLFQRENSSGPTTPIRVRPNSNDLLGWSGTTLVNVSRSVIGSGTVTSVALSLPSILTVSGSPVTTAGTLSATLATQAANLVWAGPASGAVSTPTFRALVAADIPSLSSVYQPLSAALTTIGGNGSEFYLARSNHTGTQSYTTITGLGTLATQSATITDYLTTSVAASTYLTVGGNAVTATALATPRAINGVSFDGTSAITVTAAAGTLTGSTLASNVVTSSLTGLGAITTGTWTATPVADAYVASAATWNAKENALTFSTGLTRSTNTITVNTSQNIATLSNLTGNGFIKTSGSNGTLSIDTTSYQTLSSTLTTLSSATAAGLALMDDASATAQRTTLGLGSMAVQDATFVTIEGGNLTGMATVETASLELLDFGVGATLSFTGVNSPAYSLRDQVAGGIIISTGDTGTVTNAMLAGSIAASKLVGTDITTTGTVTSGTWSGSFGAISGANLTTLNASNLSSGTVAAGRMPALTGDITTTVGAVATTLATVNSNVGSYTNASITVNAKGLITAASNGSAGLTGTLTSGRVPFATGASAVADDVDLTFSTDTLTATKTASTLTTLTSGTNSATPVMAANLINNTASISGTQSASPSLVLTGHGFRTGNSTDHTLSARNYLLPVQGSSGNPAASIVWGTNIDGGAYTDVLTITPGVSGISASLITLTTPSGSGAIVCAGGMNVGNASTNGSLCGYWTCTAVSGAFASSNRAYPFSLGGDVVFVGDAANILARRNGTTAQADRIYNTYTSSTVGEWLTLDWKTVSNVARIATEKGSSGGTARNLRIDTDTVIHATFETDGDVILNYDELPTSDPVVKGQLWRSGTALQISAGP